MPLVMDLLDRSGASAHLQTDLKIGVRRFNAFYVALMFLSRVTRKKQVYYMLQASGS